MARCAPWQGSGNWALLHICFLPGCSVQLKNLGLERLYSSLTSSGYLKDYRRREPRACYQLAMTPGWNGSVATQMSVSVKSGRFSPTAPVWIAGSMFTTGVQAELLHFPCLNDFTFLLPHFLLLTLGGVVCADSF